MHCRPRPIWCVAWLVAVTSPALGAGPLELPDPHPIPVHELRAAQAWSLEAPAHERFDASALVRLPDGALLTVNDKRAGLYRIELPAAGETAKLVAVPDVFTAAALNAASGVKAPGYDLEGLARDSTGHLYVCDESSRCIFRYDPANQTTIRLPIDWAPARRWFSADRNASWEGIAIGGDRLFVANERETGRLFVVALTNFAIVDSFSVAPPGKPARDVHYSDLCWFEDRLWVLCRESHCVLEVDPIRKRVLAEFDYGGVERDPRYAYFNPLPYGFVEGLALDADNFWLAVDNNATPRLADATDHRPSLWRCPRPVPRPRP